MDMLYLLTQQMPQQPSFQQLQMQELRLHLPNQQVHLQQLLMAQASERDILQLPVPRASRRGPARRPRSIYKEAFRFLDSSDDEKAVEENDDEIEVAAALFDLANMVQPGKQVYKDSEGGSWDSRMRAGGKRKRRDDHNQRRGGGRNRAGPASLSPTRAPRSRGHRQTETVTMGDAVQEKEEQSPKEAGTASPTMAAVHPKWSQEVELLAAGLPKAAVDCAAAALPASTLKLSYNGSIMQQLATAGGPCMMHPLLGGNSASNGMLAVNSPAQLLNGEGLTWLQNLAQSWPLLPPAVAAQFESMLGGPAVAQSLLMASLGLGGSVRAAMAPSLAQYGPLVGMPGELLQGRGPSDTKPELLASLKTDDVTEHLPGASAQIGTSARRQAFGEGGIRRSTLHVHIAHMILNKQMERSKQEPNMGTEEGRGGQRRRLGEEGVPSPDSVGRSAGRNATINSPVSSLGAANMEHRPAAAKGPTPDDTDGFRATLVNAQVESPQERAARELTEALSYHQQLQAFQQAQQLPHVQNSLASMNRTSDQPDAGSVNLALLPSIKSYFDAASRGWNMTWCR